MRRLPRSDILAAIGFLFVALAFLGDVTFGGKLLLPADNLNAFLPFKALIDAPFVPHNLLISDMVLQNISWKALARDAILGGALPLWNPYIFSGVPFLAAGQAGVLYPLGVLFYIIRPEYAYGWFTGLHLFLAGFLMYCYLRVIGVVRFGAVVGGIAFMFSGFLVVSFLWPMVVSTAIWIPLLLLAVESTISSHEKGRRLEIAWPMIGAIALGLQFLAGHMEISFYVLFTLLYYAVCRLAIMLLRTRDVFHTLRAGVALLAMVGLGAGLASIQILPFAEVIKQNFRAGFVTYNDVINWSLPKIQALSFLMPDFFGNPTHHTYFDFFSLQTKSVADNMLGRPTNPPGTIFWGTKNYVEAASYVGVLPLVLAIAAVIFRSARHTVIFLSYAVFSLLLAFGSPLYAIFFYGIPGFDQLHTPFRWIYPYTISVTILAGIGAGHFSSLTQGSVAGVARWLRQSYALAVFLAGLAVVAVLVASFVFRGRTLTLASSLLARSEKLQQVFDGPQMLVSYEYRNALVFGAFLAGSGLILWLGFRLKGRPWLWQSAAIALLLADLFYFGTGFNSKSDASALERTPPSIEFLRQDKSLYRIATFGTDDILKPNLGMRYGLQDIRGYDTVILKQYVDFWRLMEEPHGLLYSMIKTLSTPPSLSSKWLDLLNVKYVLSSEPLNNDSLELVYQDEISIYRNRDYLPRAFLVHRIRPVASAEQALAVLRDADFDPRREVVIQDWPANNAGIGLADTGGKDTATVISYSPNQVIVDAQNDSGGVLVLSDTYFDGWDVTIDEQEAQIYRANYNFRAVPLPAGSHTVKFVYSPLSLKVGLLGSFISLLLVGLGLAAMLVSRGYTKGGNLAIQRVAKNSFAPMATSLVNKVIDVAFAMLMLRILLPDNVGKYMFASIVYAYFEIFTNFGLATLVQREVARDRAQSNRYLTNTMIFRLLLVLAAAPTIAVFLYLWRAFFGLDSETTLAIILLATSLLPANIAAAFSSLFLAHEKMEYPALVTVGTTLLKVVLGGVALLLGWGIVGLAGVSVVVNSVTAVVFVLLVVKVLLRPRIEIDGRLIRGMLGTSWPLMINQLLATMFFRIDIPIMQSVRGNREVGFYSTAYKFIDGLNIIPSTFTIALFPVLSRYADSAKDSFVRAYVLALRFLLLLSIPIAVGTAFLAEPIILLFGGREYLPHSAIALQILIWFLPFSYVNSLTQYVLIAINQQRFITTSFLIAASFNIAANLVLIPRYGYVGASVVTILSEIVLLLPFFYVVRQHLGRIPLLSLAIRPATAAAVMAAVLWQMRDAYPLLTALGGTAAYGVALIALGTFSSDDVDIARKLFGREARSQTSADADLRRS
ncbi:MAG: oligosaccharide flippase family protein [Chloroflexi bacterium]|nr:oligosaccharide flippase family protein [Chloroflexota bacterium]